jgi:diaminobutyrate-2-oxoglutarate transaminase
MAAPAVSTPTDSNPFESLESNVRLYYRTFPVVFSRAHGSHLHTADGTPYLDFSCGGGTLNYGHDDGRIVGLLDDGLPHGADPRAVAEREFRTAFAGTVLAPRGWNHRVRCCGPAGTDAVAAAVEVARKATGRAGVVAFAGGDHGMPRGSLAVTGSGHARAAAGNPPDEGVTFLPYEDGPGGPYESLALLERMLTAAPPGMPLPAAVIVEPVRMEGGVHPAPGRWLRRLRALTRRHGVVLICDETRIGCGRTGSFFCVEQAGVEPDLVTVSRSISGCGLPMSLLLIRPELDESEPGEHTGTFRGSRLAFVAATQALRHWRDPRFRDRMTRSGMALQSFGTALWRDTGLRVRGRGMLLGIDCETADLAADVQRRCFDRGLVAERCGRQDEVLKLLPALTITAEDLTAGLATVREAVEAGLR